MSFLSSQIISKIRSRISAEKINLVAAFSVVALLLYAASGSAQTGASLLKGSVSGAVAHATESGRLPSSTRLENLTLYFAKKSSQKADLANLIHDQQDSSSPLFHHWLTPAQYQQRFGVAAADVARAVSVLQGQGFSVVESTPLHIRFSGAASQVEAAFKTQLHQYKLGERAFYSNDRDVTVPESLSGMIASIGNLNSFRPAPQHRTPEAARYAPNLTTKSGSHYTVPNDIKTIYDVNALYTAGYTGAGQTLVIVGQSAIDTTDLNKFHTMFGGNLNLILTLVPFSGNSATYAIDEGESDLDIEYSGSIAKDATVNFVYTGDDPNYGAFDAIQYAIDNNLAPVISISYGACEMNLGSSQASTYASIFDQALAQGQTLIAASGDSGATACDRNDFVPVASGGLTVQFPSDAPEVTGIGGTEFNEGSGSYWNATNGSGLGSAQSYIPEVVWNDTDSTDFQSSGGGASIFFTKPAWQTGVGVPADGARDIPDISLDASDAHDGYFYCGAPDVDGNNCSNGYVYISGGTSFGAPIFSGIMTLINQASASSGMGNINPLLYPMAASAPAAFHDIVTGNNDSPCSEGSTDCPTGTTEIGFSAGTGYDQATGLGTIDAYLFAQAFPGYGNGTSLSATNTVLSYAPTAPNAGANITFTATVGAAAGGTPSGSVTFYIDGNDVADSVSIAGGIATYASSPLSAGTHLITAKYFGDNTYAASASSVTLPVAALPPTSVVLSVSPAAPTTGTPVNVVARVSSGIIGTLTGTIDFAVDGNDSNNPITLVKGVVGLTLPSLTAGPHSITAQYSGDSNYAPGSGLVAFNVLAVAANNVTLSLSPTVPSITDTIAVSALLTAGTTGSVQFALDGTASGSPVAITGAKATASFGPLAAGSHSITANYTGDGVFAASTGSMSFEVSSSTAAFTLSASNVTVAENQSVDTTVTVVSPGDYAGTVKLALSGSGPQGVCFQINGNPTVAAHASTTAVVAIYTGSACASVPSASKIASLERPASGDGLPSPYLPTTSAMLAGALLFGLKRRSKAWKSLLGVLLLGVLGMTIGCGGASNTTSMPVSATGTYTLTITGTDSSSTSNTASTTFTLVIK